MSIIRLTAIESWVFESANTKPWLRHQCPLTEVVQKRQKWRCYFLQSGVHTHTRTHTHTHNLTPRVYKSSGVGPQIHPLSPFSPMYTPNFRLAGLGGELLPIPKLTRTKIIHATFSSPASLSFLDISPWLELPLSHCICIWVFSISKAQLKQW